MAQVCGHKAIGVVLSGMGHDGTAGLMKIRECGGVTIVQDPGEATIGSMPQSAIDAGIVDFVLTLDQIAEKLMGIGKRD
jgi:two-component system CheB/CheR fusion protein